MSPDETKPFEHMDIVRHIEALVTPETGDHTLPMPDGATPIFRPSPQGLEEHRGTAASLVHEFGAYELIEEIARGGMGVVYKARQTKVNRIVALKMILTGHLAGQSEVRRFYAEAEAAANLDHPHIVPVFEVGECQGRHYFSMAYVEGRSLQERVRQGPLPPREAAALTQTISEAIAYAHSKGVVHRDLKPANILLDQNGEPRVTDFGLAKRVAGDSSLTQSGAILGTPSYMSPEQASGKTKEVGPSSDVYSLGAILYCLLTGRPPFQAATPVETVLQVVADEPVSPRLLNNKIPRDLETICLKCLEKVPARRYASADELTKDLGRFLIGEPILARPMGPLRRGLRWCSKPAIAAIISLGLVLAIGLSVGLVMVVLLSLPTVSPARETFRRTQCGNNLKSIAMAMLDYHEVNQCFPPAYVADRDGKPRHSWRVLILPYLDQGDLFRQYNMDEPWDSPNNLRVAEQIPTMYQCPSDSGPPGFTDYMVITGPETVFNGAKCAQLSEISDGADNTLLVVEIKGSKTRWTEPIDIDLSKSELKAIRGPDGDLGSKHPNSTGAVMADGTVRFLTGSISQEKLRSMATKAGNEPPVTPF